MKNAKRQTKLVLARETLRLLSEAALRAAAGGGSGTCLAGTNNHATCGGQQQCNTLACPR
jgi:hypothetical protein